MFSLWGFPPPASHVTTVSVFIVFYVLGFSTTCCNSFCSVCLWGFPAPASHVATVSPFLQHFAFGVFHHLPIMLQQFHNFYSVLPLGFSTTTVTVFRCSAFGVFHHLPVMLQQFHSFYSVLPLGVSSTAVSQFLQFCLWVFPPPASHVVRGSERQCKQPMTLTTSW